jgi:hypothetical protein
VASRLGRGVGGWGYEKNELNELLSPVSFFSFLSLLNRIGFAPSARRMSGYEEFKMLPLLLSFK